MKIFSYITKFIQKYWNRMKNKIHPIIYGHKLIYDSMEADMCGSCRVQKQERLDKNKNKECVCCKNERSMNDINPYIDVCSYCFNVCDYVYTSEECTKTNKQCEFVFPIEDVEIQCENINCDGNHKGDACFGMDENGEQWITAKWSDIEGFINMKANMIDNYYKSKKEAETDE